MIPFREIQNLADKVRDKTQKACFVSVEYRAYSHVKRSKLVYDFYIEDQVNEEFGTVTDLKAAMSRILKPKQDVGVAVKNA